MGALQNTPRGDQTELTCRPPIRSVTWSGSRALTIVDVRTAVATDASCLLFHLQGEAFLEQWVLLARMTAAACQDAVLKAIDDPKVFVFGELLDVPNVEVCAAEVGPVSDGARTIRLMRGVCDGRSSGAPFAGPPRRRGACGGASPLEAEHGAMPPGGSWLLPPLMLHRHH